MYICASCGPNVDPWKGKQTSGCFGLFCFYKGSYSRELSGKGEIIPHKRKNHWEPEAEESPRNGWAEEPSFVAEDMQVGSSHLKHGTGSLKNLPNPS